jgi:branched-chain amino acid transport system ATP-binding protein
MLEISKINSYHADSHVLHDVSFAIKEGEVVSLLGRNGAGKTTTLLTIMGYLKPRPGRIIFQGRAIEGLPPYRIARMGFGFVPQEREIFASLTVEENLIIARPKGRQMRWNLGQIYQLFPRLKERKRNLGNQLSGGEQQVLAIARALMTSPTVLLLDEPSEGLAPLMVEEIVATIHGLRREGLAIILVEQNLKVALDLAHNHLILSKGTICFSGTSAQIENEEKIIKTYLAV